MCLCPWIERVEYTTHDFPLATHHTVRMLFAINGYFRCVDNFFEATHTFCHIGNGTSSNLQLFSRHLIITCVHSQYINEYLLFISVSSSSSVWFGLFCSVVVSVLISRIRQTLSFPLKQFNRRLARQHQHMRKDKLLLIG